MAKHVYPKPSIIKSVQYGTIAIGSGTSNTATINEVDVNNSIVFHLGYTFSSTLSGSNPGYVFTNLFLTNSTTVTATRNESASAGWPIVSFCVVEFVGYQPINLCSELGFPATVNGIKSLQRGSITLNAQQSNTATINEVDTSKAVLIHTGRTGKGSTLHYSTLAITLTNGTTITASGWTAQLQNVYSVVTYEVVEFY